MTTTKAAPARAAEAFTVTTPTSGLTITQNAKGLFQIEVKVAPAGNSEHDLMAALDLAERVVTAFLDRFPSPTGRTLRASGVEEAATLEASGV